MNVERCLYTDIFSLYLAVLAFNQMLYVVSKDLSTRLFVSFPLCSGGHGDGGCLSSCQSSEGNDTKSRVDRSLGEILTIV